MNTCTCSGFTPYASTNAWVIPATSSRFCSIARGDCWTVTMGIAQVSGPAPDPLVHRHRRGGGGVDRAGRAELADREDRDRQLARRGRQARALLAEQQRAALRQLVAVDRRRARQVVDPDDRDVVRARPAGERRERAVM